MILLVNNIYIILMNLKLRETRKADKAVIFAANHREALRYCPKKFLSSSPFRRIGRSETVRKFIFHE